MLIKGFGSWALFIGSMLGVALTGATWYMITWHPIAPDRSLGNVIGGYVLSGMFSLPFPFFFWFLVGQYLWPYRKTQGNHTTIMSRTRYVFEGKAYDTTTAHLLARSRYLERANTSYGNYPILLDHRYYRTNLGVLWMLCRQTDFGKNWSRMETVEIIGVFDSDENMFWHMISHGITLPEGLPMISGNFQRDSAASQRIYETLVNEHGIPPAKASVVWSPTYPEA